MSSYPSQSLSNKVTLQLRCQIQDGRNINQTCIPLFILQNKYKEGGIYVMIEAMQFSILENPEKYM